MLKQERRELARDLNLSAAFIGLERNALSRSVYLVLKLDRRLVWLAQIYVTPDDSQ